MHARRFTLLVLCLAIAGFAFAPAASATTLTFQLTENNITRLNGTSIGTVTVADIAGGVRITIQMDAGYDLFLNNEAGKGGKIFLTTTGSLSKTSMTELSFGNVTGFETPKHEPGHMGSFTFSDLYSLSGGKSQSTFSFELMGITAGQLDSAGSIGFHFIICASGNCPNVCSRTGFVETGSPSAVPEPGTLGLLATGVIALGGAARRRFSS
jgi:PEP-CTERM motif